MVDVTQSKEVIGDKRVSMIMTLFIGLTEVERLKIVLLISRSFIYFVIKTTNVTFVI